MPLWSALEHMLSVMTPANLRWPWASPGTRASVAMMRRPKRRRLMGICLFAGLFAGGHEVRGGCAGIHDPDTARRARLGKSEGFAGRARNGDGHVASRVRRIAHGVIPDRSELRLYAGSIFLGGVERGLFLSAHRLELQ